ncbi:MAG: P-loop NTPase fold protein [Deltaproteobacteria bacterium]|nr:P-loop NTPase fold protein [Deltaproteobacteria bacterium]
MTHREPPVSSDRALRDPLDDRLGYAPFARQLATSVLRSNPSDGLVVAIYGPWGSGKSSALNFITHYLEQDPDEDPPVIVHFNPWWFSGQEDLLKRFFDQFRSAIAKGHARKRKLLSRIAAFGSAVADVPLVPTKIVGKAVQLVADGMQTTDIVALKSELAEELKKTLSRVIVVIDDIDRLTKDEIRQLFRIVKAVADFPNVIYLLAFDREVAATALEESHGMPGGEYLEKIVQVPFELPPPEKEQIHLLLFERLNKIIADVPEERFDRVHWANVFHDGIEPFVVKPRDVVRLTNTLSITFPAVANEVDVVDFIAIETLRVFCPVAYDVVRRNPGQFTGVPMSYGNPTSEREAAVKFHDAWLSETGKHRSAVRALILRLFPRLSSVWGNVIYGDDHARRWRRDLKVCSPDVLPVYFRLSVSPSGVSNAELVALFALAGDATAFAARLREMGLALQPSGLIRARVILDRVNDRIRDQGDPDQAASMIAALFLAGDDLMRQDTRQAHFLDIGVDLHLRFVLQRLVRALPPDRRLDTIRVASTTGTAISTIVYFTHYLAAQHKPGRESASDDGPLLTIEEVERLKASVVGLVMSSAQSGLMSVDATPNLPRVLFAWKDWSVSTGLLEWVARETSPDGGLLRFIEQFSSRSYRQGLGDHAGREKVVVSSRALGQLLDMPAVIARVTGLIKAPGLSAVQRDLLQALITDVEAVREGRERDVVDDD